MWRSLTSACGLAVLMATAAWAGPAGWVGTVFPLAEVPLVTQAGGRITSLPVKEGDWLRSGQFVLTLDQGPARGEIRLLEAQISHRSALRMEQLAVDIARRDLARDEALHVSQNLPFKDLEGARDRLRLARERASIESNRLLELRQQLALKRMALEALVVTAPTTGLLASLLVNRHQVIGPGHKVGTLVRLDQVLVEAFVPLADSRRLRRDAPASVKLPDSAEGFLGRIRLIGENVDPVSGTVRVKVQVPNARLRLKPGMQVRVLL